MEASLAERVIGRDVTPLHILRYPKPSGLPTLGTRSLAMNSRRRGVPKKAGASRRSNVRVDGWDGGLGDEGHPRSVHLVDHNAMAGLAQGCIQHSSSPRWHHILTICLLSEWMPKVTYTIAYTNGGAAPLFIRSKLSIYLCHGRCLPHRTSAWTMSYNPECCSKPVGSFGLVCSYRVRA